MIELSEFVRVAALRSRNFINEAMPTWKKLRPNTPLHVLAYIHFAEPPLAPVHPDLRVWFAPYPTSNLHFPLLDPRQQEPWRRRFAQWPTMNDRLGFYEYFESKPSPNGFYLAANLRAVMARPDHRNALLYAEMSNDRDHDGIGNGEYAWDIGLTATGWRPACSGIPARMSTSCTTTISSGPIAKRPRKCWNTTP